MSNQDRSRSSSDNAASRVSEIKASNNSEQNPVHQTVPAQSTPGEPTQQTQATQPSQLVYSAIPETRRYLIHFIVTLGGFLGPLSGNIYLPALPLLARVFNVGNTAINATVSVFMVVFAIGPLIWASQADRGGRRPLYLISIPIFIAANVAMAAAPPRFGALVVLRIIQAFGACSVISMGAGTIADITPPAKRAFAMSIFSLGPQLGPVTGGVIGGALAGNVSWRWIFGLLVILGAFVWLLILLLLPETLRYLVGNGTVYKGKPWILFPPPFFTRAPKDPIPGQGPKPPKPSFKTYWNLFSYPPIGIVSFNSALLFASFYCIATSLPVTLERDYHWSTSDVGLAYLAPGVAMAGSSLVTGQISDWHRKKLIEGKKKQAAQASAKQQIANGTNGVTTTNNDLEKTGAEDKPGTGPTTQQTQPKLNPESRLLTQYPGVIISALGTFLYGWLLDRHLHPAPVLVGASLAAGGMSSVFVTSQAFCTEVVPTQAAATVALANMLRNPAAAVAAAIVQPLIDRMGIGWCFTGLGILNIVGVGAGLGLIWWRGEFWRSERERKLTEQKETQEMKTKAPG